MITFGNDFEFFIHSNKENRVVSAIDLLKRNKHTPIELGDNIKLYYDNCLGEVAFPPYSSKDEMLQRFHTVFSRIQNYLGSAYQMVFNAGHTFEDDQTDNDEAKEIGCEPSFDVYEQAPIQSDAFPDNFRSSGGHWHIGGTLLTDDFAHRVNLVKLLDIYLGCANVVYSDDPTEAKRRTLYGFAGNHRLPPYGVEYRTLSSSFLNSREQTDLSFDLIQYSLNCIMDEKDEAIIAQVDPNRVKLAINNCDKSLALKVLEQAKLPKQLMNRVRTVRGDFYTSWGLS